MLDEKRLIEVCAECGCASCWHGDHMCWESTNAGTKKKTVAELDLDDLEHPCHYSKEHIKEVYGEEAPHGYEA